LLSKLFLTLLRWYL